MRHLSIVRLARDSLFSTCLNKDYAQTMLNKLPNERPNGANQGKITLPYEIYDSIPLCNVEMQSICSIIIKFDYHNIFRSLLQSSCLFLGVIANLLSAKPIFNINCASK